MRTTIAQSAHDQKWMLTAPLFIICVADMPVYVETSGLAVVNEETAVFDLKRIIPSAPMMISIRFMLRPYK